MSDASNPPDANDKPAILQESEFVVEEGILYRACRTGAIWTNKLFFSSAVLWGIWLLVGYFNGASDCAGGLGVVGNNSSLDQSTIDGTCSVMLTQTSLFLGGATIVSFLLSIGFGLLGLVVGKRILETTRVEDEVGAEEQQR